jgi:hypothetical protein
MRTFRRVYTGVVIEYYGEAESVHAFEEQADGTNFDQDDHEWAKDQPTLSASTEEYLEGQGWVNVGYDEEETYTCANCGRTDLTEPEAVSCYTCHQLQGNDTYCLDCFRVHDHVLDPHYGEEIKQEDEDGLDGVVDLLLDFDLYVKHLPEDD